MKTKDIRKAILSRAKKETIPTADLLSSGSTQLNLACTDRFSGAYPKGKFVLIVGDSEALKTWLALTALAEATLQEEFKDYRLIYDAPEDGADMDKAYFFGDKMIARVEPPCGDEDNPGCSETAEDFYDNINRAFDQGTPFIYVLDSETALEAREDVKLRSKNRKAREKDTKESGSYGTAKAKVHSNNLKSVKQRLRKTGSILIMICQTRERIGFGAQFDPKTRPGGKALRFYCHLELWTAIKESIKKEVKGKKRQIGTVVQVKVKKNRLTGKKPTVEITHYHSSGIDDIGSCIKYLLAEGHWKKQGGKIDAPEINEKAVPEETLIALIDGIPQKEKALRQAVKSTWKEIQEGCEVKRNSRYTRSS